MEDSDAAYPRFDERYDTYKLGGSIYFHDIFDYRGVCSPFVDEAKRIIDNVRSVYPPSLEDVAEQLEEFLAHIDEYERLQKLRENLYD